jgi:nitrite reductase (NADH) small subunit/3-phenylpropionate/trans-cinnamate dioxygenase ferredoxin subunit
MPFTKVAKVAELPPGKGKQVMVNGVKVALFNVNGAFFAINDTCSHRGGPLSEGSVSGTVVECPWHGAKFDVTSGAHLSPPARSDVASYKVQVSGDDVEIEV